MDLTKELSEPEKKAMIREIGDLEFKFFIDDRDGGCRVFGGYHRYGAGVVVINGKDWVLIQQMHPIGDSFYEHLRKNQKDHENPVLFEYLKNLYGLDNLGRIKFK